MTDPGGDMDRLMREADPEFERIMECVFGLHEPELRVYEAVTELPGSTVTELADELGRDRSTINRSLSTLFEKGIVDRERRLLDGGGYAFQYYPLPIEETKARMQAAVDRWAETIHEKIDGFEG